MSRIIFLLRLILSILRYWLFLAFIGLLLLLLCFKKTTFFYLLFNTNLTDNEDGIVLLSDVMEVVLLGRVFLMDSFFFLFTCVLTQYSFFKRIRTVLT